MATAGSRFLHCAFHSLAGTEGFGRNDRLQDSNKGVRMSRKAKEQEGVRMSRRGVRVSGKVSK